MLERIRMWLRSPWAIWLILVVFVAAGVVGFRREPGEDLASSYVGCRLVATGQTGVLYAHDPTNFADVGDMTGTWERVAGQGGFRGYLHPYVQTPLWAYILQPVCDHANFQHFKLMFLFLAMLSMAASVWLVARFWTPWLYHALGIGPVLICLAFSQPFRYAMFLVQTHALFFLFTIAGLVLAQRRWPLTAGFLVACATAVKLTPGILLIYWLLTRRWKAAASLVVCSVVLMGGTFLAVGSHLTFAYLADLHRVSRVLLVAQNNQSFAAWVMGRFYGPDEVFDINILPLPAAVRYGSLLLMIGCTVAGGLVDRWRARALQGRKEALPPIGAMLALIALTVFAPIAWTHYSIVLVAPVMVLLQEARSLRNWWLAGLVGVVVVLNYPPLASDVNHMDIGDYAIVRGQLLAGVLCLAGLVAAAWMSQNKTRRKGA